MSSRRSMRKSALSIAMGLCLTSLALAPAHAQSATGAVAGRANAGETVSVTNTATGLSRTVTVGKDGTYRIGQLPPGDYTLDAGNGEQVKVNVALGGTTTVNLTGAGAVELDSIQVVGSKVINRVDVRSTESATNVTREEIARLPVDQSIASVALLAPGVVDSGATFGGLTFGGSSVAENAVYINGLNVTDPYRRQGYSSVPFAFYDEFQVKTGGYSAEFGRTTGGVINAVTRSGGNEFHAGAELTFEPSAWDSAKKDHFHSDGTLDERDRTSRDGGSFYKTNIWASGALVKDKLFFFAMYEMRDSNPRDIDTTQAWYTKSDNDFWGAKIDWRINDDHLVEFLAFSDKAESTTDKYAYTWATATRGDWKGNSSAASGGDNWSATYTGHFTDNFVAKAMYGVNKRSAISGTPLDGDCSIITRSGNYTTAFGAATTPEGCHPSNASISSRYDKREATRLDFEWTLGDHLLRFGLDQEVMDSDSSVVYPGDGVSYQAQAATAGSVLPNGAVVPVGVTRIVDARRYITGAPVTTEAQAFYIEDNWNVTPNLLLNLGLRFDKFHNKLASGTTFAKADFSDMMAPRLGFSWDVKGDSTFKVFGNMGRYHLALPNNVSVRGSNPSLSSAQYFTYTGIAADGTPIGLTAIPYTNPNSPYTCANGGMSSNVECGYDKDPRTIAQIDLKPHYQDEFILGMERTESPSFSWGAKATYRDLKNAIDDICPTECFIFNAGTNEATFWEDDGTGNLVQVTHNFEDDFGTAFPKLKRKYLALDMYAQYQKGDFFGKVDYTLSHNWGNAEGQLNSSVDTGNGGQGDVSVTQDWDLPELMYGVSGSLPNNRTHQIKMIGSYRFADEWRVGGSAIVQSGRPRSCYSYWPYAKPGLYNNAYYSYCGVPGAQTAVNNPNVVPNPDYVYSPRGSIGETPWTATFNANVSYMPNWMEGLTVSMDVLNLFNTQTATGYYERSASSRTTVNPRYEQVLYYTNPRSVRFTVRYDF